MLLYQLLLRKPAKDFEAAENISISLGVNQLKFWYLQPVSTYLNKADSNAADKELQTFGNLVMDHKSEPP